MSNSVGIHQPNVLSDAAEQAIAWMSGLPDRLNHGTAQHMQHVEMADRVRALAEHLRAVLQLTQAHNYPAAFALLRVALEHHLVDELIFRGRHHRQVYWGVTSEMWAEWQRERAAGAAWASDIVHWERTEKRGGTVIIRRRGLYSQPDEDGKRTLVSIYYFLVLSEFNPLVPPPASVNLPTQEHPIDPVRATQWAERNREIHRWYLCWVGIRSSLLGENFLTEDEAAQLDVHYRFLSAYVHPLSNRNHATYGVNKPWPSHNRATSTLCLLYVLTLASRELQDYLEMSRLEPSVAVADESELVAGIAALHRLASPLWFPGQPPHQYDHNTTARRDRYEAMRTGTPDPPARTEPLYYNDPLRRITAIQSGWEGSM